MKYRLFWTPESEEKFDAQMLGIKSAERKVILELVRKINTALVENPYDFGESRFENYRLGFMRPLEILFEVQEDVRTVILFDIRINT